MKSNFKNASKFDNYSKERSDTSEILKSPIKLPKTRATI